MLRHQQLKKFSIVCIRVCSASMPVLQAAFIQQLQQFVRSQRHDYVQPGNAGPCHKLKVALVQR